MTETDPTPRRNGPQARPQSEHADIATLERALGGARREYLALRAPARPPASPAAARWHWPWAFAAATCVALVVGVLVNRGGPAPSVPGPALADLPVLSLSEMQAALARTGINLRAPPPPPPVTADWPPRIELPGLRAPSPPPAVPG